MNKNKYIPPKYYVDYDKESIKDFDLVFGSWWYKLWVKFKFWLKNAITH